MRYFCIPVHMIFSISHQTDKKNPDIVYLDIFTKDFRNLKFQILLLDKENDIYDNIRERAFPGMYTDGCFAPKYTHSFNKPEVEASSNEVMVEVSK